MALPLDDFFRRITGQPMALPGATMAPAQPVNSPTPTPATVAQPSLEQLQSQDYQRAAMQRVGQLGMLLMAAGQRMTPRERATILAQAPQFMDGMQTDVANAAQARLMGARAQSEQADMARSEAMRNRLSDPQFLQSLGVSPQVAEVLGEAGIRKLIENQAMANTPDAIQDRKLKDAQIQHYLNPPRTGPTPQMVDLPGGGKGWATPGSTDIVPIAGAGKGTTEEPKKTEAEVKGYQFAQQTIDAYKKLADPEYQYALRNRHQAAFDALPLIPFSNQPFSSNDYRTASAASSAMTDAILRNKSGATIHDPEIQDEIRRVIPRPGDTDQDIQDKVNRQRMMVEGFIGAANPADRPALRKMFEQANQELMQKYTKGSLPAGVRSITPIQ